VTAATVQDLRGRISIFISGLRSLVDGKGSKAGVESGEVSPPCEGFEDAVDADDQFVDDVPLANMVDDASGVVTVPRAGSFHEIMKRDSVGSGGCGHGTACVDGTCLMWSTFDGDAGVGVGGGGLAAMTSPSTASILDDSVAASLGGLRGGCGDSEAGSEGGRGVHSPVMDAASLSAECFSKSMGDRHLMHAPPQFGIVEPWLFRGSDPRCRRVRVCRSVRALCVWCLCVGVCCARSSLVCVVRPLGFQR
jgi:hypothetical protein